MRTQNSAGEWEQALSTLMQAQPEACAFRLRHTVGSNDKKTLIFGLTQQFLKVALYIAYDIRPPPYYLCRFLDPSFLSNDFLSYELTVCCKEKQFPRGALGYYLGALQGAQIVRISVRPFF